MGLREHNRQRRYWAISNAAIRLFLEKGYDAVPVAEVAAAAGISKPTLFRYFPAKEDLVLHRFADHEREAADVVAGRPAGRPPLDALRQHFIDGLDRRDPVTGLNDADEVLAFHRLLYGTPALVARIYAYTSRTEDALTEALAAADETAEGASRGRRRRSGAAGRVACSGRGWRPGRSSPCSAFWPWRTGGGSRPARVPTRSTPTRWPRRSGDSRSCGRASAVCGADPGGLPAGPGALPGELPAGLTAPSQGPGAPPGAAMAHIEDHG